MGGRPHQSDSLPPPPAIEDDNASMEVPAPPDLLLGLLLEAQVFGDNKMEAKFQCQLKDEAVVTQVVDEKKHQHQYWYAAAIVSFIVIVVVLVVVFVVRNNDNDGGDMPPSQTPTKSALDYLQDLAFPCWVIPSLIPHHINTRCWTGLSMGVVVRKTIIMMILPTI